MNCVRDCWRSSWSPARTARFAGAYSGQLPVAEHLPRLLPADSFAAIEKVAGVARGIQARGGDPQAISREAVFHAAHRRPFQEDTRKRRARRCAQWSLRFAEDFMRLRRDTRNFERLTAAMERIILVRNERTAGTFRHKPQPVRVSFARRGPSRGRSAWFPTPSSRRTCEARRRSRKNCWRAGSIPHRSSA